MPPENRDDPAEFEVHVRLRVRDVEVLYSMARAVLRHERRMPEHAIDKLIGTIDAPLPKTCLALVCLRHDIPGGAQIVAAEIQEAPLEGRVIESVPLLCRV